MEKYCKYCESLMNMASSDSSDKKTRLITFSCPRCKSVCTVKANMKFEPFDECWWNSKTNSFEDGKKPF